MEMDDETALQVEAAVMDASSTTLRNWTGSVITLRDTGSGGRRCASWTLFCGWPTGEPSVPGGGETPDGDGSPLSRDAVASAQPLSIRVRCVQACLASCGGNSYPLHL